MTFASNPATYGSNGNYDDDAQCYENPEISFAWATIFASECSGSLAFYVAW